MLARFLALGLLALALPAKELAPFLDKHCLECHDSQTRKGDFDLEALKFAPTDPRNHAAWVKVHDQIATGEMPPRKKARPEAAAQSAYLADLGGKLAAADSARLAAEGRTVKRRLNRFEYESTLRDLLAAPWLDVRESLPEDSESHRFNKSGQALDVSHVQLARYLATAEDALRQVLVASAEKLPGTPRRFFARDQGSYVGPMKFSVFNTSPSERPSRRWVTRPSLRSAPARPRRRSARPTPPSANSRASASSPAPTSRSSRNSAPSRHRSPVATGSNCAGTPSGSAPARRSAGSSRTSTTSAPVAGPNR